MHGARLRTPATRSAFGINPPGQPAPPWTTREWFGIGDALQLSKLRGKVVVLHAFQMLCPACVHHGLPQAQRIHATFAASGVAYIGGTVLSLAPGMHLFAADRDTYRDLLPSGVFVYQDTEIGAPAPDQIPGALRVGVTRTSSTAIIGDSYLCSYRLTSAPVTGDPFKVS